MEHHWLDQADAELQICLLLLQKNFAGKLSAEKVEQIIHNILRDLFDECCTRFIYTDQ